MLLSVRVSACVDGCPSLRVRYCADDWLLKFYFAAREVTNSISGLRPVTLEMEKQTAEAQEAVQRLTDKQARMQQQQSDKEAATASAASAGSEDDEKAVDESEGVGQLPTHSATVSGQSQPQSQQQQQQRRGGDADGYGIENWDLTGVVDGHTDYPRKIQEIFDTIHFKP